MAAADGVNPLHRRHAGERTAAATRNHLELEQRDVLWRCAGRVGGDLADDRAAIHMLPVRSGVVTADGLAVQDERRDGLAEGPSELAVRARLAFVDLRAFGVPR